MKISVEVTARRAGIGFEKRAAGKISWITSGRSRSFQSQCKATGNRVRSARNGPLGPNTTALPRPSCRYGLAGFLLGLDQPRDPSTAGPLPACRGSNLAVSACKLQKHVLLMRASKPRKCEGKQHFTSERSKTLLTHFLHRRFLLISEWPTIHPELAPADVPRPMKKRSGIARCLWLNESHRFSDCQADSLRGSPSGLGH